MVVGRRRARHRAGRGRLTIAISFLMVAVGIAGVSWSLFSPRSAIGVLSGKFAASEKPESPAATSGVAGARTEDGPGDPDVVAACRDASRRAIAAVDAADRSVDDWDAHITAMADLESGKNTEAETKAIWTKTRLEGPGRVERYRQAKAEYWQVHGACERTLQEAHRQKAGTMRLTSAQRAYVQRCQELSASVARTLNAADQAVAEWKAHLKAMADRRAGKLHPDTAQQMWLEAYRKAPTHINAFREAQAELRQAQASCPTGREGS